MIGVRVGRKMWSDLRWVSHIGLLGVRLQLTQNWRNGVIRRILCGLCSEAAVLVLIFPLLDWAFANQEISGAARSGTTTPFVSGGTVLKLSLLFAAITLFGAFILGRKEHGE